MNSRTLALCGASTVILAAMNCPAQAQQSAPPTDAAGPVATPAGPVSPPVRGQAGSQRAGGNGRADAAVVTEIVVTAQKRQENINSVGMSIQAATGQQLTRLGVTDTSQLTKIVPGFSYAPSAYGTPVFSIRGVGFQDTSLAASPTVSVYTDEVPLPFSIMTSGASLDLQRVEVLKGPQGTLFGENATGGAINYIANKPTDTYQGGFDVSYGRFNAVDAQGFFGGPITDTLDFRVALRTQQSGPWQESYTRNDQLGSQNFNTGRISLLWKPTTNLRILAVLSGFKDQSETQAAQLYGLESLNGQTGLASGLINYPLAPHNNQAADWGPCVNIYPVLNNTGMVKGPHNALKCSSYRKDNTLYSGSLRIDYDLPNGMTLTSLSSYERFDRRQPLDGDGTTYMDYESLQRGHLEVAYQELRLSGKFGNGGNWIVGGNYENDDTWDNFLQTYPDSSSGTIFGQYLGPTRPINQQYVNTYAVFGNVEYPVTDAITVQGGVRYTTQYRHFYGCGTDGGDGTWSASSKLIQQFLGGPGVDAGPGGCGTIQANDPLLRPGLTYATLDEDNVAWRAGVNWKIRPGTLAYINVSQGYKSGSFPTIATAKSNQLQPAVQEGLLAYEIGVKSALFDRKMQLNAAAFYYDYKNKQILGDVLDPVFGALPALVNVPNSHVVGFEVSGNWRPFRGLTITPSFSFSHSEIDECDASLISCSAVAAGALNHLGLAIPAGHFHNFNYQAQQQDFSGEAFPLAPEIQADIDVQYEWPLRDDLTAFVGANLNYQGETNSGFGEFSMLKLKAYPLLDLRAGVEKGPWRFQVYGRNVANEYYWTGAYHVNDVFVRYTGAPATYGATLQYRFQ